MKRGEIWTAAGGADYARKPRPVLILQDDHYWRTDSLVVCPVTSERVATDFLRPPLEPNAGNGLRWPSCVMVDKVSALPRMRLRDRIGQVQDVEMREVETALSAFLGMAR